MALRSSFNGVFKLFFLGSAFVIFPMKAFAISEAGMQRLCAGFRQLGTTFAENYCTTQSFTADPDSILQRRVRQGATGSGRALRASTTDSTVASILDETRCTHLSPADLARLFQNCFIAAMREKSMLSGRRNSTVGTQERLEQVRHVNQMGVNIREVTISPTRSPVPLPSEIEPMMVNLGFLVRSSIRNRVVLDKVLTAVWDSIGNHARRGPDHCDVPSGRVNSFCARIASGTYEHENIWDPPGEDGGSETPRVAQDSGAPQPSRIRRAVNASGALPAAPVLVPSASPAVEAVGVGAVAH